MSEDQEDPAKVAWLAENYFISRREYDITHRNVEDRLVKLVNRVDGHETQLSSIDAIMNRLEAEQFQLNRRMDILIDNDRQAKDDRYNLLLVCQGMQTDVQNFMREIPPMLLRRVTWAGAILVVMVAIGLMRDLILPLILKAFGL